MVIRHVGLMKMTRIGTYVCLAVLVATSGCATSKVNRASAKGFIGTWITQESGSDLARNERPQTIKWITFKTDDEIEWYERIDRGSPFRQTHSGPYMIINGCLYDGAKPSDAVPKDNPMILQNMRIENHPILGKVLKAETSDGIPVMFAKKKE